MSTFKRVAFLCLVAVTVVAYQDGAFANHVTFADCSWAPVAGMGIAQDENDAADASVDMCNSHDCDDVCAEMTTYLPECEEYTHPPASGPYDCTNPQQIQFSGGFYYYGTEGYCDCPYDVIPIN